MEENIVRQSQQPARTHSSARLKNMFSRFYRSQKFVLGKKFSQVIFEKFIIQLSGQETHQQNI
jgi:hypothetical protein